MEIGTVDFTFRHNSDTTTTLVMRSMGMALSTNLTFAELETLALLCAAQVGRIRDILIEAEESARVSETRL